MFELLLSKVLYLSFSAFTEFRVCYLELEKNSLIEQMMNVLDSSDGTLRTGLNTYTHPRQLAVVKNIGKLGACIP